MMNHPINNDRPGIAQCAVGDTTCEQYPQYMRGSALQMCRTCAPLRALTNKKVANLLLGGLTMAQSFMINSAIRMHPEEFQVGVGAGAAAAQMFSAKIRTTKDLLDPSAVKAIQTRIRKHAPLRWTHAAPDPKYWPGAVGVVCAAPFGRCVEVPGGGDYNRSNTHRACDTVTESCPALKPNEWLAVAGSFTASGTVATFKTHTRVKKSTINSSLQPPAGYLKVKAGQVVKLAARGVSQPLKVDQFSYQMLTCAEPRCGL